MKKMYIVIYHTGEYEDSIEWNLIALPTRTEAELFIEELIGYWNNPEYPYYLNFLLDPESHGSLKWMGIELDEDALDIMEIPFFTFFKGEDN